MNQENYLKIIMDRLLVNKIIYAKRIAITSKEINAVLQLEVDTNLSNNKDLVFKGVGKVINNENRSQTYPLIFISL